MEAVVRTKADYALLWANGMSFAEVYDLMKADIEAEIDKGFDTKCDSGLCDCGEVNDG